MAGRLPLYIPAQSGVAALVLCLDALKGLSLLFCPKIQVDEGQFVSRKDLFGLVGQ